MEKRFQVLRIIGTLWKIMAWIALILGVLFSLGVLVVGLVGSGGAILRQFGQEPAAMPGAVSAVGAIVVFFTTLLTTVIYFLSLYAIGELIYLLLSIEENTRRTAQWVQGRGPEEGQVARTQSSSPQ